jgi:hypothetical protein
MLKLFLMIKDKINFAMVGCGSISKRHIAVLDARERAHLECAGTRTGVLPKHQHGYAGAGELCGETVTTFSD